MLKILLIVIIICEIAGLATRSFGRLIKTFIYYTQLSNLAALLSAVLLLCLGPLPFVTAFRYLAVCMLIMTMLVTIFVLVPTIKDTQLLLWSRVGFLLHLLCPALNITSYLFFEPHVPASMILLPPVLTLIYGLIMIYMNYQRRIKGPYPFFLVHDQSVRATILWIIALLILVASISAGVWFAGI